MSQTSSMPYAPSLPYTPAAPSRSRAANWAKLLIGPGMLAMLGENDGPSMLSYAATGASYGIGFFLPFILVTFAAAYVIQEMAMRIALVTGRGYGALMFQRFGQGWGWISAIDLLGTNLVTILAEVIAIRIGMGFFGIPAWGAVLCAVALIVCSSLTGRYARWEAVCAGLAIFNLLFIVVAVLAHPSMREIALATATWSPLPQSGVAQLLLVIASNVGATVTPWMLFFQQSASVDKQLSGAQALRQSRINTMLGAIVAAVAGCGALVAASPLFIHHIDMAAFQNGAGFAQALSMLLGRPAGTLFALGLIEAGAVAMLTISASSAYAAGESIRGCVASFDAGPASAPLFHGINIGMVVIAGGIVLIPGVPLMAIVLNANLLATILMPAALVFLLLMANDRELMGDQVNGRMANILGMGITIGVTVAATACVLASSWQSASHWLA
ncbi:NRAMP family divalent metal transporter [Novosphingobium terrae]|uniref:NRAMP family divalent metal transporter n=1 Tax=Novosphingobium terrae TaxID=2726189 RepID=UPI001980A033|nr:divalent metal cation transporter [Novosphingobium terrae]